MDEPPSYTVIVNLLSGQELNYILSFGAIALLVLFAALIAASEASFFTLKSDEIERCRQSTDAREKAIAELLSKPRLLLATLMVAGTLMNLAIVIISALLLWDLAVSQSPSRFGLALFILLITFVLTVFGKVIPKVYAINHNLVTARSLTKVWKVLIVLFKPLSVPFLAMSSMVEKRFEKKGYLHVVDELNQALDLASIDTNTTEDEKEILRGIVNFGTLTVRQVMRPRLDMSAADVKLNFHELMDYVNKSGFSRIPVYRETLDSIEGVLYIKDLLPFMDREATYDWRKLLRPVLFVPGTKKIDSLLKDFQEKRVHMALVIDEYGGTAGLITLEDIIEEIFGDINDEFDEVGITFQKIDDHTFVFEGKTSLHDFCKALDIEPGILDPIKGDSESLGGLILEINHELPKAGAQIRFEHFTFTIESVDRKRIKRVKVYIHEEKES